MTHVVEHTSIRYTWELVRHFYIIDLEEEIEIRQVEVSPSGETRLPGPPYPVTRFFEVEIDQIQRDGRTVYSFRNICPVEIRQIPDWHILNCRIKIGSSRVLKRFRSVEGEAETRWLYTDDFFLISLSSGDRHDLGMLLSLIQGKLNMIALSIQSGRRIRSELENQLKFRATMGEMFADGVDGAFREVPVFRQHGEMTESEIDISAALRSAELQDLNEECAAGESAGKEEAAACAVVPPGPVEEPAPEGNKPVEYAVNEAAPAEPAGEESTPLSETLRRCMSAEPAFGEGAPEADGMAAESPLVPDPVAGESLADSSLPETRRELSCSSCGAGISRFTKFCGRCGSPVSTCPPGENAPAIPATPGDGSAPAPGAPPVSGERPKSPSSPDPTKARLAIDVTEVEELRDLSWLTD